MARDIAKFPIKPSVIITVFKGVPQYTFRNSRSGDICDGDFIVTEFSNRDYRFPNHSLLEVGKESSTKKLTAFFKENNINGEFENATGTDILLDFLNKQGYDWADLKTIMKRKDKLYIVIPKTYKKPKGDSFKNTFDVCSESFAYGSIKVELDVYMTPISLDIKSIKFRVDIPNYIYEKCMENTDVENQPKTQYIENENLSILHSEIQRYSSMARSIYQEQKASEKYKKKIVIQFHSKETSERDSYNFAYTGQKISTNFNWFTIYEFNKIDSLMVKIGYFTFLKKESSFSSIRKKHNFEPDINGVVDLKNVNGKCYLSKPSGVIIDWTQEREDFFNGIENNFRKLSENLNNFLSDLDSEKVDLLIKNSTFKFLN